MGRILGIRADWKALAFCLLAACSFWFMKALNNDFTDDINYPVKIEYNSKSVVPLKKLPKSIRINVTGYGWSLLKNSLGIGVPPIVYDPGSLPQKTSVTAEELLPFVRKQISDISLNYIVSDSLNFYFDRISRKRVKVVIDSSKISLAPNYKIVSAVVSTPDSVLFMGPSTILSKLPDSISVDIDQKDIRESFDKKIKLPEQSTDYRITSLYKDVRIRFAVSSFEKENIAIPLESVHFPDGNYTYDEEVILTYYVKKEDMKKVRPENVAALLDFRKMDMNDSTIKPTLQNKPSFIRDYYFTPYAVKIRKGK